MTTAAELLASAERYAHQHPEHPDAHRADTGQPE